ncbi:MAG: heparin lyase I family protein [Candidatus Thiodiazotropha endolucinida]
MGIHGNYGSTATATRNIESEGRGPDIAINEAGNITSGGARVSDGVAFAHDSKMEVYDNAGNHLGSSDVLENGVDATLGDVTFTFSTPIPVDNETVRAYVWGDNLGSGLNLAYDGGSGRNFQGLATYPTPPDPDGSGTDGRYYAVWVTVTPTASRSADSLTGAFRRGNTGVTVNCTGLDTAPTTQTVTVTDGTHSDTCTITNWNSGDPIINIDCALPPGAYDIQVTDDTGTVTLSGQTLLIETNWEEVVFDGNTPPANQESLSEGSLEDFPAIPEIVAGDSWGVQSHADVTWQANGSVIILPAGEHTLSYWFWDDSTGVMYSGETIVIGERPDLTSPTLTSAGQNTMQGTVDTDTDTGTLYAYWSTSATPPSATDLKAGTGAAWSGNQAITSTGTKTFNATGLVAGTTYYAHFLHDNSGSESDISTSAGVATDSGGGDTTPPVFTAGPAAANPTTSGHDIQATLDEDGTIYAVRLPDGAAAPSSAQVKAGQDSTGSPAPEADSVAATASVQASITFSGGAAGIPYDYYVVAEDDEGTPNLQASPTLVEATTTAGNNPPVINDQAYSTSLSPLSPEYINTAALPVRAVDTDVTDFEGNTHSIPAGTPLREGSRIVDPIHSDDSGWIADDISTWSKQGTATTPDYRTMVFGSAASDGIYSHRINDSGLSGHTFVYTLRITATAGDVVRMVVQDRATNAFSLVTITLLEGTHDYSMSRTVVDGSTGVQAKLLNDLGGTPKTIYIEDELFEDVTGQANQNPSTITDTLAYSDYTNGNTVDVNNVVVSGSGRPLGNAGGYVREYIDNENYSVVVDGLEYWRNNGTPTDSLQYPIDYENGGLILAPENTIVRSGSTSVKFEIPSSQSAYATNRSELRVTNSKSIFCTNIYKFSVYFPATFAWPDDWFLFCQLRQHNAGAPIVSMEVQTDGTLRVRLRNESYHSEAPYVAYTSPSPIERGQWIDFKLRVKGGINSDGELSVWKKLSTDSYYDCLVDVHGISIGKITLDGVTPDPDQLAEFKLGIYRGGSDINHVVYFDEIEQTSTDIYWPDIGTVQASDPDEDPLTYSIVAGNTDNDLTIDPNTGVLSWANTPDITRTASYNLTVQVSDGTDTATATVTVNVVEAGSGVHRKLTLGIGIGGF